MARAHAAEAVATSNEAGLVAFLEQKYPGIEISKFREVDLVEAYVPARHIYVEDVPVDEAHVDELYEDIKEELESGRKSGQTLPVWLGQIDDFDQLPVIDGFHRSRAISRLPDPMVYSAISLGTTWEKVIDERIIAANMHKSVRFSRVIEWVNDAWSRSPWQEQIDATQAFSLALRKGSGSRLLPDEDVEQLRNWVDTKCKQWKLSVASIYDFLSVSSIASPELVNEARERPSGHELTVVTPSHLKAIATALPNRFDVQEFAASVCVANNLTVPLSRALATRLANATTIEEARAMVAPGLIDSLTPEYSSRRPGEVRGRRPMARSSKGALAADQELVRQLFYDELLIAKLSIDNLILRARHIPPPIKAGPELSTELKPGQRDIALRRVGLQDATVWTPRNIRSTGEVIARIEEPLARQLIDKKGVTQEEAEGILMTAKQRLLEDVKNGALRFEVLDDEMSVKRLFLTCVSDEAARRKRPDPADSVSILRSLSAIDLKVNAVEGVLPRFDTENRQMIVYHFIYNLAPHTTARILGLREENVLAILPDLSKNLKHKAVGFGAEINEDEL